MKHTITRLAAAAVASLTLLGFAACGISGTGAYDTGGAPHAIVTGTSTPLATPAATGATIMPGQVTVTVDKAVYAPNDVITVYVNNGLPTAIYTADHQTACTIVTLLQAYGDAWRTLGICRLMTPTRLVQVPAQTTTVVRLGGGPGQLASSPWPAGTYRIQFTYGSAPPGRSAPIYSAEFHIG